MQRLVFIGAGNVATHLAKAFYKKGYSIVQVFSKTKSSAKTLADEVKSSYTTNYNDLINDGDIYIYCVTDEVLPELISQKTLSNGVHIHTAGSVKMDVFDKNRQNFGVLYPLQTFSKNKEIDFSKVPLFIEANNDFSAQKIRELASVLSKKVFSISSENRQKIHLSAVFACNFTNHLFSIAQNLLGEIPFEVLLPLIEETVEKVKTISPKQAQTGPAKRRDNNVIEKHLKALSDKENWQEIYKKLTEDIQRERS